MTVSTIQTNNKLVQYRKELWREYIRENRFSPYMGASVNSIIRLVYDQQKGGEQINIPIVTRLTGTGKGSGTLVGNEEAIDNYGMRAWIDWARNAVAIKKSEKQLDDGLAFGEVKPLLSDWGKELQRDETIAAMMALPSESSPVGLNSDEGQRVNGLLYEDATAAQRNTWTSDNSDRVIFGNELANYSGTHATALANIDTTNDTFKRVSLRLMKRAASLASPHIRPYKLSDGREYFVAFAGSNNFAQLAADLETQDSAARAREGDGMKSNPIYQDGDLLYRGVIVREVPEIDNFVDNIWTTLVTAGNSSSRVAPVFLCGQQAVAMAWGQEPIDTTRKEDDYGFITGKGVEMAYGLAKVFKKHSSTKLVQLGMVGGFFSAANPA